MDTGEIKKLIEAFYNGETTAEEEQILFDYFNSDNVADDLKDEKTIFRQMNETDNIDIPPMLESKLNNIIDELARKDGAKKKTNKIRLWAGAGSIAAGLALLIFAGIHFSKEQYNVMPATSTYSQAEDQKKIEEAQKALLLLSSNFNKGMDQLDVVSTNLDKANEILDKTLNRKNDKGS